jgi:hypothetical protein
LLSSESQNLFEIVAPISFSLGVFRLRSPAPASTAELAQQNEVNKKFHEKLNASGVYMTHTELRTEHGPMYVVRFVPNRTTIEFVEQAYRKTLSFAIESTAASS